MIGHLLNDYWSFKVLYVIFIGVNIVKFRRINTCESVREAQDILKTTHEGILAIKVTKIQKLIKYFKNIIMENDEYFNDFCGKLNDIITYCLIKKRECRL